MARAYLKNRLPVPDRATAIAILSHRDSLFEGLGQKDEEARKEGRREGGKDDISDIEVLERPAFLHHLTVISIDMKTVVNRGR